MCPSDRLKEAFIIMGGQYKAHTRENEVRIELLLSRISNFARGSFMRWCTEVNQLDHDRHQRN
jgi:hypothetical protein